MLPLIRQLMSRILIVSEVTTSLALVHAHRVYNKILINHKALTNKTKNSRLDETLAVKTIMAF